MKHTFMRYLPALAFAVIAGVATFAFPALAQEGTAQAITMPVGFNSAFQEAVTPVAARIQSFHNLVMYILTAIVVFVLGLLIYVAVRFNAKANPTPSTRTHNVKLEIVWTLVPVVILFLIAIPSISLLYYADRVSEPEMTLKVTGYQWYWGYEYPDHEDLSFMANMVPDDKIDASKGQVRLLSTDNPVVVPVETDIQVIVTAADVIHNFAVPAFGIKMDGVPGRLNETWMHINKPGTYFGQCSELCGKNHAFMPIEVRAVPRAEFDAWVAFAQAGNTSYHDFKAGYDGQAAVEGN